MSGGGPLIVAIDGPSGVGKSTAARLLARRLGVPYLDTGATYRALALKVLKAGVDPFDRRAVEALAAAADVRLEPPGEDGGDLEILLDGEPVGERIRAPEVSEATSVIASYPGVRRRMVALQRRGAGRLGAVVEGRDIGTRVFPDAPFKFFLDARPEVRHRRRFEELRRQGRTVSLAEVAAEMSRRDHRDASRAHSPLTRDGRYLAVDTSEAAIDEVVERMVAAIRGTG
jgi:CMP/dCMP kinase